MVPRSSKSWAAIVFVVVVNLLLVVTTEHDGLTLYISSRFANTYLNRRSPNDLFIVKAGRIHNSTSKRFRNMKLFGLKSIEMKWFTSGYDVNYSLRATSSNLNVMRQPQILHLPLKGVLVSSSATSFIVTFPCTTIHNGFVDVNFALNYTKRGQANDHVQLTFTVYCNKTSETKAEQSTTSVKRGVVVAVSAVVACVFVLLVGGVFFWRFIKRIRKKFWFVEELSPLREVTSHSANVSMSPTSLPTVVYSPKRDKSPNTIFTKIVEHAGVRKEGVHAKNTVEAQPCLSQHSDTTANTTTGIQIFRTSQLLSEADDDDVFISEQASLCLLQRQEDDSPLASSLSLAKETEDKRQMFSTLNEYWATELGTSLKSFEDVALSSEILGEGAFSHVYRGKLNQQQDVAVKVCKDEIGFEQMVSCVNEAILIKTLPHENLMHLLGVVLQTGCPPLIITPLMMHGDLHNFLRHSRGIGIRRQLIGSRQLVNFGTQIAHGMEYLAGQKIVHRDLAARNCFVDDDLNVKIGDFGLARRVSQFDLYKMEKPGQLAVKWLAIESLLYYIFTEKSDVWSFGILLWELVTLGSQPYAGLDNYEVTPYLETGKRLSRPLRCPDDLFAIMYSCWLPQPEERPSFTILLHKLSDYEQRLKPSCIAFEFDEDTIEMADDCEPVY